MNLLLKDLEKMGIDKAKMALESSIKNCWAGVFEPRNNSKIAGANEWANENNNG